jgi:hypothetical protein
MFYIITTPHSFCQTGDARHCDTKAQEAAELLYSYLLNQKASCVVIYWKADQPRSSCDQNRIECRQDPWRKHLTQLLTQAKIHHGGESQVLLLDIHSFNSQAAFNADPDIALIQTRYEQPEHLAQSMVQYMSHYSPTQPIQSMWVPVKDETDIVHECAEIKISSCLIEFNERLNAEQIASICRAIADFLIITFK